MSAFRTVTLRTTVTVTATAYEANDNIGGKLTIPAPEIGVIDSVRIVDQAAQAAAMDVVFFYDNPSGTTFTDETAQDMADADLGKTIGHVGVTSGDYSTFADNSIATVANIGLPYTIDVKGQNGACNMYVALVARGTPTFAATTDLELAIGIIVP